MRRGFLGVAAVLAAVAVAGCGSGEEAPGPAGAGTTQTPGVTVLPAGVGDGLPPGVVARVVDVEVSEEQLEESIASSVAEARADGHELPAKGESGYADVRRQVLESLTQAVVVDLEAEACGAPCEVTDEEINQEIARIVRVNFGGSRREYRAFLAERRIDDDGAAAIVRGQLQQQALFDHVTAGISGQKAKKRAFNEWSKDVLARYAKQTTYAEGEGPE